MKNIWILLAILLAYSGCSTVKVDVDYDTAYSFKGKGKYSIVHNNQRGEDTLTNDRIIEALKSTLNAKSYVNVPKDEADLIFVFHVNVADKTDIRTDYQMVGYGGFGYRRSFGGGMIATPSTYKYTEGKLVVDVLNPKTHKILWRGIVSDELSRNAQTPEQKSAYINSIITKLIANFPRKAK